MRRSTISLFLALAVFAGGCFHDDPVATDPVVPVVDDSSVSVDGDGIDSCGQGQAFPDDPDFREAICEPMLAMVDLIGTDAEILPEWNTRITTAILGYADDRAASIAELNAVFAEIQAAG